MIYRDFQGDKLSALGLGMMRLPVLDGDDKRVDEEAAGAIIDRAYRGGINYFDTAWGYHGGMSERVAGKFLSRYPRESYRLATKFPGYDRANLARAREIFETQLEKCQTPYFDFYLCHNVNEGNVADYLDPELGLLDYLMEEKRRGRIRHLGFSCHGDYEVLRRFLDGGGERLEFCQLQLNYLDWHFQNCEAKAALLRERGVPLWVMEPLRGGKLAKASDEMAAGMAALRPAETVPGMAFRFLQAVPGATVVLSGMSTLEQLEENLKTFETDEPLTGAEFEALVALADGEVGRVGVPCTACRYCVDHCPQGLPIPELLAAYNEGKLTGGFLVKMMLGHMPPEQQPDNCVGCRTCEGICPQQIEISQVLHDLAETARG